MDADWRDKLRGLCMRAALHCMQPRLMHVADTIKLLVIRSLL